MNEANERKQSLSGEGVLSGLAEAGVQRQGPYDGKKSEARVLNAQKTRRGH